MTPSPEHRVHGCKHRYQWPWIPTRVCLGKFSSCTPWIRDSSEEWPASEFHWVWDSRVSRGKESRNVFCPHRPYRHAAAQNRGRAAGILHSCPGLPWQVIFGWSFFDFFFFLAITNSGIPSKKFHFRNWNGNGRDIQFFTLNENFINFTNRSSWSSWNLQASWSFTRKFMKFTGLLNEVKALKTSDFFTVHNNQIRRKCKSCGGSSLCEHNSRSSWCKSCGDRFDQ